MNLTAERLLDRPIVEPSMDSRIGCNINGPSLIAAPDWIPERLGNYYLYFAHHKGSFIRLAYADELEGPWAIYSPGVLDVTDSLFEKTDLPGPGEEGRALWSQTLNEEFLYAHVASPDVHVDHKRQRIRMYYHGLIANGDQQTRLADSIDGLHFSPRRPLLGPPYFRVFTFEQKYFAVSWAGEIWRGNDCAGPFERGPRILPDPPDRQTLAGIRHTAVAMIDDSLVVFYSRIGDRPERIVYTTIKLQEDWHKWTAAPVRELMVPELEWEGADRRLAESKVGEAVGPENALRDPCFFRQDSGEMFLLYAAAGESAIGIARLYHDGQRSADI